MANAIHGGRSSARVGAAARAIASRVQWPAIPVVELLGGIGSAPLAAFNRNSGVAERGLNAITIGGEACFKNKSA